METITKSGVPFIDYEITGLPRRSLIQSTCEFWGYGWSEEHECHVANYRNPAGRIVAQKLRGKDKDFRWTGSTQEVGLYGEWLWRDGGRMVVVTEGEIDALSMSQLQNNKWPVVSVPNGAQGAAKSFTKSLSWLERFDRVVIMFDMDEPGRAAAEACARILTPGKAYIANLPGHDVNDLLQQGRGDEVIKAMWDSHLWAPDGIIEGDDLFAVLEGSHKAPIYNFPFPDLQEKMHGIRPGEITLLAAGIFAGKSTLCRSIAASALDQGLTLGVIPLEETVQQFLRGLLGARVGKNVRLEDVPEPELREALVPIKDQLVFYQDEGRRGSATIFDQLRWMSVARKVDLIILDHITIVIGAQASGGDDRKYADTLMAELESLVKRTQVPVVVVAHLKKTGEGKK